VLKPVSNSSWINRWHYQRLLLTFDEFTQKNQPLVKLNFNCLEASMMGLIESALLILSHKSAASIPIPCLPDQALLPASVTLGDASHEPNRLGEARYQSVVSKHIVARC
jgi:hypothetical protein